ncbi:serpentine type 7TM GPCR chemoreceptor srt domain-containing protein [Ditylenchus destructor]|uniref:Serpentine type 7TM GPCR chemoreceptor srt domain-containing protein n=1 Tax=Ditylenchus destructor TaxID=166010 RepID=A0AAD4R6B2_9BILA|nr:serpentine type 7TM GPCR chemoreceptor srt domain-containing protein [Ditylenchus destructor]
MEMFIFRPEEYNRLYNCAAINVDDVPLEKRQHIPEAIITIFLCLLYYILYIPCIISIYKHLDLPVYRLIFFISITNCFILWMLGFLHGILSLFGAVFCSYSTLIYICGCVMSGIWITVSLAEVSLTINRCLAILAPNLEKRFFGGWRVSVWIVASLIYGTSWCLYVKPVLFNGIHFTWFFNPFIGYTEDYNSVIHIIWDMSVAVGIPSMYILFVVLFNIKVHAFGSTKSVSHKKKMMFIQVFIISMFNFMACSVYVYMMYTIPIEILVHFAQFCWFHIHAFPPVIYLILNKTIRDDAKRLVYGILSKYPRCRKVKRIFATSNMLYPVHTVSDS